MPESPGFCTSIGGIVKILVVDDSKTMRHVLIVQLKELGYDSIMEADCVQKAKLLLSADLPSLIISDWNMPGATGLDLLKAVKGNARTSDIPFIMLTTETDRTKIVEATKAGLQSYMLKPVKKPVLIEKLRELASAYGFTPPVEGNSVQAQSAPPAIQENHPLKGKIKSEQVAKIVEAFGKVLSSEATVTGFEEFVAKEIFGGTLEDHLKDVEVLMEEIRNVAGNGVEQRLDQLSV